MKKFLPLFLASAVAMFAAAANDIVIGQRTSDNQFDQGKILINGTGVTITYNSTHITINSTGGFDGTSDIVTTGNITANQITGNATTMNVVTLNLTNPIPWAKVGNGGQTFALGNLIVGNNTTTSGQLAVGANGTVLTANNTAALGMSWETPTGGASAPTISNKTADYTLALADEGNIVTGTSGSTITFTIPPQSSVAFTSNAVITVGQLGAGEVVIDPGAGVTVNGGTANLTFSGQYEFGTLVRTASDTWVLNYAAATGTGAYVKATSPTLTTPNITDGTYTNNFTLTGNVTHTMPETSEYIGLRDIPQNPQSGNYTITVNDLGRHIYHASGDPAATYTIPANATISRIGAAVSFVNYSANNVTITLDTDTLRFYNGTAVTTGDRTLVTGAVATAFKTGTGEWTISGNGGLQ